MSVFGLEFANFILSQLDFVELILTKSEFGITWFMFENFYVKSEFDKMNVAMILIKITFGCIITKKDLSFIL